MHSRLCASAAPALNTKALASMAIEIDFMKWSSSRGRAPDDLRVPPAHQRDGNPKGSAAKSSVVGGLPVAMAMTMSNVPAARPFLDRFLGLFLRRFFGRFLGQLE